MQSVELDGLRFLRTGTMYLILPPILVFFGITLFITTIASTFPPEVMNNGPLLSEISAVIGLIAILIIAAIIGLVGVLKVKRGFDTLSSIRKDVGIGSSGSILYLVGFILMLIGAVLSIIFVSIRIMFIGLIIAMVGLIIAIVGNALTGAGIYKVGDIYGEDTTKIGGILAALPIGIISLIGYLLSFIGLEKIINMVSVGHGQVNPYGYPQQPTYQQPLYSTQPQFYQVGQGIIQRNGYARVSLYASAQGIIVSAVLQGLQQTATYINPTMLNPGNNDIVIHFNNVSQLQVGSSYTITLTINSGGNTLTVNAVVVCQG